MDNEPRKDYVLLEGWSEVAAFETIVEGLRFQEFMEHLHPRRKFDLCLKRGGFIRLREGWMPIEEDVDPLDWLRTIAMQSGGMERGRRSEDAHSQP